MDAKTQEGHAGKKKRGSVAAYRSQTVHSAGVSDEIETVPEEKRERAYRQGRTGGDVGSVSPFAVLEGKLQSFIAGGGR
jgi:hypothetical protein